MNRYNKTASKSGTHLKALNTWLRIIGKYLPLQPVASWLIRCANTLKSSSVPINSTFNGMKSNSTHYPSVPKMSQEEIELRKLQLAIVSYQSSSIMIEEKKLGFWPNYTKRQLEEMQFDAWSELYTRIPTEALADIEDQLNALKVQTFRQAHA